MKHINNNNNFAINPGIDRAKKYVIGRQNTEKKQWNMLTVIRKSLFPKLKIAKYYSVLQSYDRTKIFLICIIVK